jgi:hypothetical protein
MPVGAAAAATALLDLTDCERGVGFAFSSARERGVLLAAVSLGTFCAFKHFSK